MESGAEEAESHRGTMLAAEDRGKTARNASVNAWRVMEHNILDVLQKHWLYLKVEKCTFECTTVEYLGLVLSEGWVEMYPIKIAGVRDWPPPKNITKALNGYQVSRVSP